MACLTCSRISQIVGTAHEARVIVKRALNKVEKRVEQSLRSHLIETSSRPIPNTDSHSFLDKY